MDIEMIRAYCLSLMDTTEEIKWEENLCFMIHKKIYVIISLNNGKVSFKVDPEVFDELIARDGIMQATHFAKRQWVSLLHADVMAATELKQHLSKSRSLVIQKLPKKIQALYTDNTQAINNA